MNTNTAMDTFRGALVSEKSIKGLQSVLPSDIDIDRFTAVVIRAVQEDPDLLNADRTSLFLACQRAAQDGLIPDKREGALVVFNTKVGNQWTKMVQWQVMIGGIRKRLAKCGFDIRAEVIHENDHFDQDLGDSPTITHKPPPLGEPRGEVIGAYAIATDMSTGEKWREVMNIAQLLEVRSVAKSDGIWNKWTIEMYRKTAARRLYKYLPITNEDKHLESLIQNDNDNFDFDAPQTSPKAKEVQAAARKQKKSNVIEHMPQEPIPPAPVAPEPAFVESENPAPVEEEPAVAKSAVDPGF